MSLMWSCGHSTPPVRVLSVGAYTMYVCGGKRCREAGEALLRSAAARPEPVAELLLRGAPPWKEPAEAVAAAR